MVKEFGRSKSRKKKMSALCSCWYRSARLMIENLFIGFFLSFSTTTCQFYPRFSRMQNRRSLLQFTTLRKVHDSGQISCEWHSNGIF